MRLMTDVFGFEHMSVNKYVLCEVFRFSPSTLEVK
jgi:hypothetical protein